MHFKHFNCDEYCGSSIILENFIELLERFVLTSLGILALNTHPSVKNKQINDNTLAMITFLFSNEI